MSYTHTTSFFSCLRSWLPQAMSEEHGCSGTLSRLHGKLYRDGGPILAGFEEVLETTPKKPLQQDGSRSSAVALGMDCDCPSCHRKRQETPRSRALCSPAAQELSRGCSLPTHSWLGGSGTTSYPWPTPSLEAAARAPTGVRRTWTPAPFPAWGSHRSSFCNGTAQKPTDSNMAPVGAQTFRGD